MLSAEYYGFRPSSTAVDTVSLHALDPTEPRKRKQTGFLLAPIKLCFLSLDELFITKINIKMCVISKSSTFFLYRPSANFIITKVLDKQNCLELFLFKNSLANPYYLQHSFCLVDFIIDLKKV